MGLIGQWFNRANQVQPRRDWERKVGYLPAWPEVLIEHVDGSPLSEQEWERIQAAAL